MPVGAVARSAALEVEHGTGVDGLPADLRELLQESIKCLGVGGLPADRFGAELEPRHLAVANALGELLVRKRIEYFAAAQIGRRVAKQPRVGAVADAVRAVTAKALSHVESAALVDRRHARQRRADIGDEQDEKGQRDHAPRASGCQTAVKLPSSLDQRNELRPPKAL